VTRSAARAFPLGADLDLWGGDAATTCSAICCSRWICAPAEAVALPALHHDLWDYDLVTGPKLLTVRHNGKPVDIVAQATKFGPDVFDRERAGPSAIEERVVPVRCAGRACFADAAVSARPARSRG
jgi:hypothetical protein